MAALESEGARDVGHVKVVAVDFREQDFLFESFRAFREGAVSRGRTCRIGSPVGSGKNESDVFERNGVARRQEDETLNDIPQFAEVSRPGIPPQRADGVISEDFFLPAILRGDLAREMADEFGEVVQPLAERRQNEGKDVNAMKEVATEGILLDEIFQIAMSGDEDADIHLRGLIASDALDLSFFEGAKQLGLHGKRHIADFVEEEGAAIGLLEFADMTGAGSGERAFLVAEEFGLDEFGGNGGAVEGDEGCFAARGFLVNGASDKLFAGTRFAQNADAGFTGGHAVDLSEELLHGGTRAN